MNIAVNTRLLLKDKLEGIGWFIHETMQRITKHHPEHTFYFLFDRPFDASFIYADNIKPVILKPQSRHPVLWYLWFEHSVPSFLRKNNIDLFISPDGYSSVKAKTKKLTVIHDINFFHFPENLPLLVRKFMNHYTKKYVETATRVCTVSAFSKKDIATSYGIAENKIDVCLNGANEVYAPVNEETKKQTREKYTAGNEYFIFVGAFHKRKNIHFMLTAFDKFKNQKISDVKFVLVGEKMFNTPELSRTYDKMKHKDDLVFTGRLHPGQLKNLLGSALALVFASTFEGFGIPIIEAMQCDTPVITSNTSAMPEIAGNAALICDPYSVDSIQNCMQQLYADEKLRETLVEKGRLRKQKFSWDKTAESLWESIETCLRAG